jgi:hypothetical protein
VYVLSSAQRTPGQDGTAAAVAESSSAGGKHALQPWALDRTSCIPFDRCAVLF